MLLLLFEFRKFVHQFSPKPGAIVLINIICAIVFATQVEGDGQ